MTRTRNPSRPPRVGCHDGGMSRRAGLAWIATLGVAMAAFVIVLTIGAHGGAERANGVAAAYDAEQLCNAATIIDVGSTLGLSARDQTIAVMTAIGESSLRNIEYGDWETSGVRNPDGSPTTSIGLFQQQDEWGSREERLDPQTAATLFYRAMTRESPPARARRPHPHPRSPPNPGQRRPPPLRGLLARGGRGRREADGLRPSHPRRPRRSAPEHPLHREHSRGDRGRHTGSGIRHRRVTEHPRGCARAAGVTP